MNQLLTITPVHLYEDMEEIETSLHCAKKIRVHLSKAAANNNLRQIHRLKAIEELIDEYQSRLISLAIAS